jgi:hypothetical protein
LFLAVSTRPDKKDGNGTGSPEMRVGRLPAARMKGMDNILLLEERGTGKGM